MNLGVNQASREVFKTETPTHSQGTELFDYQDVVVRIFQLLGDDFLNKVMFCSKKSRTYVNMTWKKLIDLNGYFNWKHTENLGDDQYRFNVYLSKIILERCTARNDSEKPSGLFPYPTVSELYKKYSFLIHRFPFLNPLFQSKETIQIFAKAWDNLKLSLNDYRGELILRDYVNHLKENEVDSTDLQMAMDTKLNRASLILFKILKDNEAKKKLALDSFAQNDFSLMRPLIETFKLDRKDLDQLGDNVTTKRAFKWQLAILKSQNVMNTIEVEAIFDELFAEYGKNAAPQELYQVLFQYSRDLGKKIEIYINLLKTWGSDIKINYMSGFKRTCCLLLIGRQFPEKVYEACSLIEQVQGEQTDSQVLMYKLINRYYMAEDNQEHLSKSELEKLETTFANKDVSTNPLLQSSLHFHFYYLLGAIKFDLCKFNESSHYLEQACKSGLVFPQPRIRMSLLKFYSGDFKQALEIYSSIASSLSHPAHSNVDIRVFKSLNFLLHLWEMYSLQGDKLKSKEISTQIEIDKAIGIYMELLKKQGSGLKPAVLLDIFQLYKLVLGSGTHSNLIELDKLLEVLITVLDPNFVFFARFLADAARVKSLLNSHQKADELYTRALGLSKERHFNLLFAAAAEKFKLEQYEDSIKLIAEGMQTNPSPSLDILMILGLSRLNLNQLDELNKVIAMICGNFDTIPDAYQERFNQLLKGI